MPGLLDMYDPSGQAQQLGFFDTIGQNRNSLIGLGLGLAGSTQPGFGDALQGFQRGASQDAQERARRQQMAQSEAARRQAQSNFERTFARSDPAKAPTEFGKISRDLGLTPGTPEYLDAARQFYSPKTEGDWQITKLPHPTIPGDEITVERNKRTGQTRLPQYPGTAGAAPTDAFTGGIGQPAAAPAIPSSPSQAPPAGWQWGDVNPQTGRRKLVAIDEGPATKLPEGAASKLAMLEAAKPGLEEAKKYFLDPKPLTMREGGDQAGGALYSMGKQYLGEKTNSFEIGRQRRNVRYGIEAALRAATGAAAPEPEVDRYTDMYAPSIQDSYATRKQKIEALERFISTYEEAATRGHGGKPASRPAAAPSSGGVRRYNPETRKIE